MAGRLTRFLNLELPRGAGEEQPHQVVTKDRFDIPTPSGISLQPADPFTQPFVRCPSCEADNQKLAVKCFNCQRRLDTEEVEDWNAQFWAQRQAAEAAATAAGEAAPSVHDLSPEQQRQFGEALAREVGERERARMGWESSATAPGLRLLRQIGDPSLRLRVAIGLAALFVGAAATAFKAQRHSLLQTVSILVAVGLFGLFMPSRRRRRWWDRGEW